MTERMTAAEYRAIKAKPKGANDWEAAFGEHLRMLHRDGVITEPRFEAVKLPLLPPCGKGKRTITFTPDWTFEVPTISTFLCSMEDQDLIDLGAMWSEMQVAIDVKGHQREDAWLKIRLSACLYPDIAFFIVKKKRGGWKWERVRGGELGKVKRHFRRLFEIWVLDQCRYCGFTKWLCECANCGKQICEVCWSENRCCKV